MINLGDDSGDVDENDDDYNDDDDDDDDGYDYFFKSAFEFNPSNFVWCKMQISVIKRF